MQPRKAVTVTKLTQPLEERNIGPLAQPVSFLINPRWGGICVDLDPGRLAPKPCLLSSHPEEGRGVRDTRLSARASEEILDTSFLKEASSPFPGAN